MTNILDLIEGANRSVTILGTSPFAGIPENWRRMVDVILPKLEKHDVRMSVVSESDNQLFQISLMSDADFLEPRDRASFTEMQFQRDMVASELEPYGERVASWKYKISSLFLSNSIVVVDEEVFVSPISNPKHALSRFRKVDRGDAWYDELSSFVRAIHSADRLGKFLSSPDDELLELFDKKQIPRGIFPRNSFYGTDHFQFVVWAFVFDRSGRLLIHQRSKTAKDNQSMWDKSVGGHVDFSLERSSNDAVVRELVEELFTDESKPSDAYGAAFLRPSADKMLFLGDWKPGKQGSKYFASVSQAEARCLNGEEPWFYFKLAEGIEHNSPRLLPTGEQKRLRVIADAFVFLADTKLNRQTINESLSNSKYDLVEISELKSWLESSAKEGEKYVGTPDLSYVMTGKLRDELEAFSQIIKFSGIRK